MQFLEKQLNLNKQVTGPGICHLAPGYKGGCVSSEEGGGVFSTIWILNTPGHKAFCSLKIGILFTKGPGHKGFSSLRVGILCASYVSEVEINWLRQPNNYKNPWKILFPDEMVEITPHVRPTTSSTPRYV